MNANASRSLADQVKEMPSAQATLETWVSINRPMIEVMTELNSHFLEQMTKANNEWMKFVNRRLNEDMAASRRIMDCKTMPDIMTAYSEFFQRAQQQYQAEFQYFARLNQKLAEDTAGVIQAHVEEAEADLGAAVEQEVRH
jgi:hypothetical protein